MNEAFAQIKALRQELVADTEAPLYGYRTENNYFPVLGQGDVQADIMFVGEAPGETEAKTGVPFCGASGRVLDELLESIGLERNQVYITNVVKDRPPKNRDPHEDEVAYYARYLERQIEIIQPKVFVGLGRFGMDFLFALFDSDQQGGKISELHGQTIPVKTSYGEAVVLPLYHPAVSLYARSQRETLFADFKALKPYIK